MPEFVTPFTKELRTNYVPSSLDREHINALLIEPHKRLSELNAKISEMERIVDGLKKERDNLDDEIQEHTHLLAPFRRFPDDMLREIFLACLPNEHNAIMSCREAPLLLGIVCKRWRTLVYNTPSLWASLHIPYPSPMTSPPPITSSPPITSPPPITQETRGIIVANQERLRKHRTTVKDWLLRSGGCPLSISFVFSAPHNVNPHVISVIQSYLDIMLSFSHRWHDLDLYIPSGPLFNQIASLSRTSVPMLKHLRLTFPSNMPIEEGLQWASGSFLNSASLHTLTIASIPFRPSCVSGNFWSHLSYLVLDTPASYSPSRNMTSIEEAYFIFSQCRRLVHCSLAIIDDGSDYTIPSGIISLPFLKSLTIVDSCHSLSTLFECFTDLLELRGISYTPTLLLSNKKKSSLITLLARTNGRLNYLSTNLDSYTHADLSAVFDLVPNLTHFVEEVNNTSRDKAPHLPRSFCIEKVSLGLLTPLSSGETYCPRLQSLRLKMTYNLSDGDILTFLQQRMGVSKRPGGIVEPLREFSVVLVQLPKINISSQLSEYIENGTLKLNVTHINRRPRPSQYYSPIDPRSGLVKRTVPAIIQACQG